MAFSIARLPNQPIIVLTNESLPDEAEMRQHLVEIAKLLQGDPFIYLIVDSRKVEMDFATVVTLLRVHQEGGQGSASDTRLTPIFVGSAALLRLLHDVLVKKHIDPSRAFPMVQSMDAAIEFIQRDMDQRAQEDLKAG